MGRWQYYMEELHCLLWEPGRSFPLNLNQKKNLLLIWRLAALKLCSKIFRCKWHSSLLFNPAMQFLAPLFVQGFGELCSVFFLFTSTLSSVRSAGVLGLTLLVLTEQGLYLWNYFVLTAFQRHAVLFTWLGFCKNTDLGGVQCIYIAEMQYEKESPLKQLTTPA